MAAEFPHLQDKLDTLQSKQEEWANLPIADRVELLEQVYHNYLPGVLQELAHASATARGLEPGTKQFNKEKSLEMFGTNYSLMRLIRSMIRVLKPAGEAEAKGRPLQFYGPTKARVTATGKKAIKVFPYTLHEGLLWPFTSEVWLKEGADVVQGAMYRQRAAAAAAGEKAKGGVALVLGAGNVNSIPVADALYKMFVDNEVTLIKVNPINEYIDKFVEQLLTPLVTRGYLQVCRGAAPEGMFLTSHPAISSVHITGSVRTFDAIVWGVGDEAQERRRLDDPKLKIPITAELGAVSPIIITGGKWSSSELAYHANGVAGMIVTQNSYACVAAKVLVFQKNWEQKEQFLEQVEQHIRAQFPNRAWYPGSKRNVEAMAAKYGARKVNDPDESDDVVAVYRIPPLSLDDVDFAQNECWGPIFSTIDLDVENDADFLHAAADYANEKLYGTLSCSVLIHPSVEKKMGAKRVDDFLDRLQYGGIAINSWSAILFVFETQPWGGFPGSTLQNVQSGLGFVHNVYMYENAEKSVFRAPFTLPLGASPPWGASLKDPLGVVESALDCEYNGSYIGLMRTLLRVLRN